MDENTHIFCFHGVPGSGKTECARAIVPSGRVGLWDKDFRLWDHKQFASPLKELYKIRTGLEGVDLQNRQLWLIDSVCRELVPMFKVSYEDFVELVYDVLAFPIAPIDDVQSKDRGFLTGVADLIHQMNPNAFAQLTTRLIQSDTTMADVDYWDMLSRDKTGVEKPENLDKVFIISDLRTQDELTLLKDTFRNVMVIKLDVSPAEQKQRLLERDGKTLTELELTHSTQNPTFTDDQFDIIVNSDDLSIRDQASMIKSYMLNTIKEKANA